MITCHLMGGLGNQLFQIFATISYAIKSRQKFNFLNKTTLNFGTIRYTYWNSFLIKLNFCLVDKFHTFITEIKEKNFNFNEFPIVLNENIMINGYFQSYKYFQDNYEIICKLIGLQTMKSSLLEKPSLKSVVNNFENTISMHFRIGDYKSIQNYHPLMTKEYYHKSLTLITSLYSTNFTVLYFCENVDINDVNLIVDYLKQEFPKLTFIRGDNTLEDWEQMLLMSCCHHNIIANSSFSWWGAYFNEWTNQIVCYPSIWFGPSINHNTNDLCPPLWNKI